MQEHKNPTQSAAWQQLQTLKAKEQQHSIRHYFLTDKNRAEKYSVRCGELLLDYAKNRISDEIRAALLDLARELQLKDQIERLFGGAPVNHTEKRPALHVALRGSELETEHTRGIKAQVDAALLQMQQFSAKLHSGAYTGITGRRFTDIVNIGIGGSDLGPKMVCEALREYAVPDLRVHFLSNVDGAEIHSLLPTLSAETTLFVISSKTFTTQETLTNTGTALQWLSRELKLETPLASPHVIAVTANAHKARELGIEQARIFEFQDWVGGRFSLWSPVGLSIVLYLGFDHFQQLLEGARLMDSHFRTAPFEDNMPVLMALIGLWYSNFLGAETQAVIPYCQRLGKLVDYLQQLDMESNGKTMDRNNQPVDYTTGPVLWGQAGTNGQHSFFQLLHQGSHLVPVDFIGFIEDNLSDRTHHDILLANMLSQAAALMTGSRDDSTPHKHYPGNRPSNTLLIKSLTPFSLGALIALYEHKIFVQSVLWNINAFDQWGVELGKTLANKLLTNNPDDIADFDASTRRLLGIIRQP